MGVFTRHCQHAPLELANYPYRGTALTTLKNGTDIATFASGSAATFGLLQALRSGDHGIAPQSAYKE